MKRIRLDVGELKKGMYVAELDRPWLETSFLFQGFCILTDEELRQLRDCCRYVYIDLDESRDWSPAEPVPPSQKYRFSTRQVNRGAAVRDEPQDAVRYVRELRHAGELFRKTHEYIGGLLEDVRLGHSIDSQGARELASQLAESIVREENVLVWFTQLKNRDEYTSLHSINVCILSLLFGRHLGYTVDELHELGFGALLHDIGKMRVPLEILNKAERLTDAEMVRMKEHPTHGFHLLREQPNVPQSVLNVVYCHHERIDGSGYPRGLDGQHIPREAMLVSVVDVYDAVTSDRVYHMGISPHEALNLMYGTESRSFPGDLIEEFIRCLGIFPIGSIVELSSGEVGVVLTVNRNRHLLPLVAAVLDRNKQRYARPKLLDLQGMREGGVEIQVKRILESQAFGIDVHRILGLGDSELFGHAAEA